MGKVTKTKKTRTNRMAESDPSKAMKSNAMDDSDVEEDHQVFDLSSVAAPVIEFEMPNLTPLDEMPKKKAVKVASEPTASSSGQKTVLTATLLNNEIVRMRPIVLRCRSFVKQHLVRQKKVLSLKLAKKTDEAVARRIARLAEQIDLVNVVDKDQVVKFALLNKKTREQLTNQADIPHLERCLYLLATEKPLLQAVEKYRETYDSVDSVTAYLLQRFGSQYTNALETARQLMDTTDEGQSAQAATAIVKNAKETKVVDAPSKTAEDSDEVESGSEAAESAEGLDDPEEDESDAGDDDESSNDGEEEDFSDVDMGSDSEEDEDVTENRRQLLLGGVGIAVEKLRPKPAPKRKHVIQESSDDEEQQEALAPPPTKKSSTVGKDSAVEVKKVSKKKMKAEESKEDLLAIAATLQQKMNAIQQKLAGNMPTKAKPKKEKKKVANIFVQPVKMVPMKPNDKMVPQQTIVKQIKLSDGGKIKVSKGKERYADTRLPVPEGGSDDDGAEQSDDEPQSSFFLPASGSSDNKKPSTIKRASDEPRTVVVNAKPWANTNSFSRGRDAAPYGQQKTGRPTFTPRDDKRQDNQRGKPFNDARSRGPTRPTVAHGRPGQAAKGSSGVPEELHPSWAAKRQNKEQLSAKPQGKRVVFDD